MITRFPVPGRQFVAMVPLLHINILKAEVVGWNNPDWLLIPGHWQEGP
jgi:hypothetical protein